MRGLAVGLLRLLGAAVVALAMAAIVAGLVAAVGGQVIERLATL